MADTKLTAEQGRAILEKLARDDSFRALFEAAPARALSVLGLDPATIIHLPAACLNNPTLASKEHYQELLDKCADDAINGAMQMAIPKVGFKSA